MNEEIIKVETKNNACNLDGENWLYSPVVKDHFFAPRNLLLDEAGYEADGIGVVGSPACGDVMAVWIKVAPAADTSAASGGAPAAAPRITECKWRTFGCASAIASTSMMSVMATENGGMTLARAKRLTPEAIIDRLGGLPDRKYHCSVLGHQALREAVEDYEKNEKSHANKTSHTASHAN